MAIAARVEPDAIVFDDEQHGVGQPLEDDFDAVGARVLRNIRQRFLGDSVER